MRHQLATAALLTALAAMPYGAVAQEATTTGEETTTGTTPVQLSETDMQFVQKAATDGMAEVELGEMAADKAASEEVQAFGEQMVEDHTKANDQLEQIADEKGIDLPDEMSVEAKEMQESLDALSEGEFDRAYMQHMVEDHEKAVELFQKQAESGQDPELKQFAEQTLPVLQQHLERAQQIDTSLTEMAATEGGTATGDDASPEAAEPAAGATATQQAALPDNPLGQMTADELIGKSVVNQNGEEVGNISDIVINRQDQAVLAIIAVGGFLGIGEKNVAVPFEQLQPGEDEAVLMSSATEDELKGMPAYEEQPDAYEDFPRDRPLGEGVQ
ncbi:MAG: hypothetical protein BroJett029_24910 [Alphaproteobacteria bacterium]|nr:MAG: hypothetical protein BroJett029_24910 [Alphaproteobacteria bacterium]